MCDHCILPGAKARQFCHVFGGALVERSILRATGSLLNDAHPSPPIPFLVNADCVAELDAVLALPVPGGYLTNCPRYFQEVPEQPMVVDSTNRVTFHRKMAAGHALGLPLKYLLHGLRLGLRAVEHPAVMLRQAG